MWVIFSLQNGSESKPALVAREEALKDVLTKSNPPQAQETFKAYKEVSSSCTAKVNPLLSTSS